MSAANGPIDPLGQFIKEHAKQRRAAEDKALKPDPLARPLLCMTCSARPDAIIHLTRRARCRYGLTGKGHEYVKPGGARH